MRKQHALDHDLLIVDDKRPPKPPVQTRGHEVGRLMGQPISAVTRRQS
jgi:hypothetical protein